MRGGPAGRRGPRRKEEADDSVGHPELPREGEWWLHCEKDHEHDESCHSWDDHADDDPSYDTTRAIVVMVGDDRRHVVDVDDLIPLAESEYCPECGQIGCRAYG